jgi:hypothetical protein
MIDMAFQTPITIKDAVDRIYRREYVLPAIQREFVWKPEQIVQLFDSLLKGFPIGSFLFWKVKPERKKDFQFYNFLPNYHERDATHNPKADMSGDGEVTAVLDGQQRLTALFIGLRGTHAEKRRYARWGTADAFPPRRLYLNLSRESTDSELTYEFGFLPEKADLVRDEEGDAWVRAGRVLDFTSLGDVIDFLRDHDLLLAKFPQQALSALFHAVNEEPAVSFYVERSQDLDRVLTIFIRVNSAGTVLSYSDLLLSIATAQWASRDAREEITRLVDDINRIGHGFQFNKDFVLKACLMCAGFETRFATDSFRSDNMTVVEQLWPRIESAVRAAVRLLSTFGFSGDTLRSVSAAIPVVDYLYRRGNGAAYVESGAFKEDRERVRRWLNVALLKRVFTGQPDTILRAVRDVLQADEALGFPDGFPAQRIVEALRGKARTMDFGEDELDAVLDEAYGGSYTFSTLALLYPGLEFRDELHQDHMHPKSHFTRSQLQRRGISDGKKIADYQSRFDLIPNLQLLRGAPNVEKAGKPFGEWLIEQFPNDDERRAYMRQHYVPDMDSSFGNFIEFYEARRALMRSRLREFVGLPPQIQPVAEGQMSEAGVRSFVAQKATQDDAAVRRRAEPVLDAAIARGIIREGVRVHLIKGPRPGTNLTDPAARWATFESSGRHGFRWDFDQQLYSLSGLCKAICERFGGELGAGAFRGPDYFAIDGDNRSITEAVSG